MIVSASTDDINAYDKFLESCNSENTDTANLLHLTDDIFRALRKDLGHDDRNLEVGDLVGQFLNNQGQEELRESYKKQI